MPHAARGLWALTDASLLKQLVLDYHDTAVTAGEIKLKYCTFDDNFCGCDWEISPGDGLALRVRRSPGVRVAWRGDQSTERKEHIPGGGTNRLRGKSIYLEGGPID